MRALSGHKHCYSSRDYWRLSDKMPRYRAKNDTNQPDIVKALRKIPGITVQTGHDDILVGYKGLTFWFEIKNPDEINKSGQPYGRNKKTGRGQAKIDEEFTGHYRIVWNIDQILEAIGI